MESPTGTLTYGYDVGGNRTSVTHTRGSESFTTNYAYDELSRLTEVSDGTTELAKIGYDLKGNREQVLRANGVATGYQFDSLNRLDKLTHAKGNTVLSSFDYAVRQDGKRTGVTESVVNDQTAATPRTSSRNVGFTYDDAGRLTKEEGGDGLGVSYENAWQYDAAGNRSVTTYKRATVEAPNTVATTTTIAAVFSGNDWLKEQTSTVKTAGATNAMTTFYGYDRNGAQTNERVGAAGAVEVNEWQFDGTLASTVTQGQATGGSEFVYDASGNRLKQRTKIGTTDAKEVRYLVDPNTSYAQVVQERDENNVLQARYAWEDGLAPLVMWRRTQNGAYAAFFYLCDGQDSVRQLTDATGRVTDSYFYDAFGNAQQGGSGDTPNSFRYTGQQLDPSGDYYLRARYYNSGNGRFLSHDPVMGSSSDPISMHRYLYANADGANFVDPSGEFGIASIVSAMPAALGRTALQGTILTAATTALNLVTTQIVSANIANHWVTKNTPMDGFVVSLGFSVQTHGVSGGAGVMLYLERDTADIYAFTYGEVGLSPLSLFKRHRGGAIVRSLGAVFNADNAAGVGSYGFTASWPLVMAPYALRGLQAKNMLKPYGFLTQFARKNLGGQFNSVNFIHSVGGADTLSVSFRNNSFGFSGGHASQPVLLGNLGTLASDVKTNFGSAKKFLQDMWDASWEF